MTVVENSSSQIVPFQFETSQVRVLQDSDGNPLFVAADILVALDLDRKALERIDADEKGVSLIHTLGGTQEMTTVNEPGLYSLVLGSRKPEAKRFKRWVTHEVLPIIRKTGKYEVKPLTPIAEVAQAGAIMSRVLEQEVRRNDEQDRQLREHELRLRQLEAKRRASKALVASPQQVLDIFESCARTINGVLDAEHERRKSPSKHVRSAHWRALADGRRVSVRESVVGDGESIH